MSLRPWAACSAGRARWCVAWEECWRAAARWCLYCRAFACNWVLTSPPGSSPANLWARLHTVWIGEQFYCRVTKELHEGENNFSGVSLKACISPGLIGRGFECLIEMPDLNTLGHFTCLTIMKDRLKWENTFIPVLTLEQPLPLQMKLWILQMLSLQLSLTLLTLPVRSKHISLRPNIVLGKQFLSQDRSSSSVVLKML